MFAFRNIEVRIVVIGYKRLVIVVFGRKKDLASPLLNARDSVCWVFLIAGIFEFRHENVSFFHTKNEFSVYNVKRYDSVFFAGNSTVPLRKKILKDCKLLIILL